jgi:hypothetical protein
MVSATFCRKTPAQCNLSAIVDDGRSEAVEAPRFKDLGGAIWLRNLIYFNHASFTEVVRERFPYEPAVEQVIGRVRYLVSPVVGEQPAVLRATRTRF